MSATLSLYRLQLVDSSIDEILSRTKAIQTILDDDEAVRNIKHAMTEAEAGLELAQHSLKQAELEVQKIKLKIDQSEASLYGGTVKNPKELQDIQNELASLKRLLDTLEDRQLEEMESEEFSKQQVLNFQNDYANLKKEQSENFRTLEEEQSGLQKELERLQAERLAAVNTIERSLLSKYDELRQERNGKAVVLVIDGSCAACGTTLTPSLQQNARSATQIYNCPTCGRILYSN
jgi:predicted  nucleic acid-binding Zn-ribbon protein